MDFCNKPNVCNIDSWLGHLTDYLRNILSWQFFSILTEHHSIAAFSMDHLRIIPALIRSTNLSPQYTPRSFSLHQFDQADVPQMQTPQSFVISNNPHRIQSPYSHKRLLSKSPPQQATCPIIPSVHDAHSQDTPRIDTGSNSSHSSRPIHKKAIVIIEQWQLEKRPNSRCARLHYTVEI